MQVTNEKIYKQIKRNVSWAITQRREELGMSQEDLALTLGVDSSTVSTWECGRYLPRLETAVLISAVLNIPIGELVGGDA
jgi:DNA-binding XRE family transcriptional regulator